jgi:hypothetical protein
MRLGQRRLTVWQGLGAAMIAVALLLWHHTEVDAGPRHHIVGPTEHASARIEAKHRDGTWWSRRYWVAARFYTDGTHDAPPLGPGLSGGSGLGAPVPGATRPATAAAAPARLHLTQRVELQVGRRAYDRLGAGAKVSVTYSTRRPSDCDLFVGSPWDDGGLWWRLAAVYWLLGTGAALMHFRRR